MSWLVLSSILAIVFFSRVDPKLLDLTWRSNFGELAFLNIVEISKRELNSKTFLPWLPLISTLYLFVLTSNVLGNAPWKLILFKERELGAPTNDINTTICLALLTSFSYFYAGLKAKGLKFFIRYISPSPFFLPINLLEDISKPLSLSFRLFGNILADEIVISVLCLLVPIIVPIPIIILGTFTGSIQALVLSTLAGAYVAESIE